MMAAPVRSSSQRRADALASLASRNHLWIATASPGTAKPHLVPLSYAWTGSAVIVATATHSPTAVNLLASGFARLAVGPTDDVVLIDATVDAAVTLETAPPEIADVYARQSDWDPRTGTDLPTHYFVLSPTRLQTWRGANELPGRTLMSDGEWLVD